MQFSSTQAVLRAAVVVCESAVRHSQAIIEEKILLALHQQDIAQAGHVNMSSVVYAQG